MLIFPNSPQFQWPDASAHYDAEKKVVPGHLAEIEIWLDTKIQTISNVTMAVEGTTRDISLCGLKVKSFGRNLPCIDVHTEPFYQPHDNPLDGNRVAGLRFPALSNIGKQGLSKANYTTAQLTEIFYRKVQRFQLKLFHLFLPHLSFKNRLTLRCYDFLKF